jgi:hypothetical protein
VVGCLCKYVIFGRIQFSIFPSIKNHNICQKTMFGILIEKGGKLSLLKNIFEKMVYSTWSMKDWKLISPYFVYQTSVLFCFNWKMKIARRRLVLRLALIAKMCRNLQRCSVQSCKIYTEQSFPVKLLPGPELQNAKKSQR